VLDGIALERSRQVKMVDPASGPFLFDTQRRKLAVRSRDAAVRRWLRALPGAAPVHVSSITVLERIRGLRSSVAGRDAGKTGSHRIGQGSAYLVNSVASGRWTPHRGGRGRDHGTGSRAAEPAAPDPSACRVQDRNACPLALGRIIAATALVAGMLLIHNNPADSRPSAEPIERSPGRFPGLGPLKLVGCGRLV